MQRSHRTPFPLGQAAQMHETTHVTGDDVVGMRRADVFQFELAHRGGNVGKTHGKCPAESAALFAFTKGNDLQPFDGLQKLQHRRNARRAPGMTGTMKGYLGRKFAGP